MAPKWVPRSDDPPNRGNKERPLGAPNCFQGKQFIITGILDSLYREECVDMIKEHGGKVVSAPSKKVTHAVVGTQPGESKMKKVASLKIQQVDEDWLFDVMRKSRPDQGSGDGKDNDDAVEVKKNEDLMLDVDSEPNGGTKCEVSNGRQPNLKSGAQLWVDKYAPKKVDDLVGNNKHMKDLASWLQSWKDKFLSGDGHSRKMKDRRDFDHPAVMLAGPPGIGKTSAAHAVCRAEGFEPVEFNASDVRNKGGILALADTMMVADSMMKYLKFSAKPEKNHYPNGSVLVMDEVDGMSGGDRGGNAELIKLVKTTKIPIIVICNDDSSPKMRSLAGNCFKMKFRRPTPLQACKRLTKICMGEGFSLVEEKTMKKLCEECNGDLRQMINLLQTWRLQSSKLNYGDVRERMKSEGKTVVAKGLFELGLSFFRPGAPGSSNSFEARTENYFCDSDIVPLFVQENYIQSGAATSSLHALADAAESISEADLCNAVVRGQQRWELMPAVAVLSAIRPGNIAGGGLRAQPNFPSFFGNLSKSNKFKRIVQELDMKVKGGAETTGSLRAFRLDYIPVFTTCLASPLILQGIDGTNDVIELLDAYYLEKDPDWSDLLECGVYPRGRAPLDCIKGPIKAALSRQYKGAVHRRSAVSGVKFGATNRRAAAGSDISRMAKRAGESGIVDEDPDSGDDEDAAAAKLKKDDDLSEFQVKKSTKNPKKRKSTGARASTQKRRKRS